MNEERNFNKKVARIAGVVNQGYLCAHLEDGEKTRKK